MSNSLQAALLSSSELEDSRQTIPTATGSKTVTKQESMLPSYMPSRSCVSLRFACNLNTKQDDKPRTCETYNHQRCRVPGLKFALKTITRELIHQ